MKTIKDHIKQAWYLMPPRIKAGVYHRMSSRPMTSVMKQIQTNGIALEKLKALEVFGRDGEWHTLDYGYKVSDLEIMEIDPKFEKTLHRNFPHANIKIVDSYEEVKRTQSKYDLIVIDNPTSVYGEGYCEHFKLFPKIFDICMDATVIVLNVIPELDDAARRKYPNIFNEKHLEFRRQFYRTSHPEKLTMDEMSAMYRLITEENGYDVQWSFYQKRNFVYYLVMFLQKNQWFFNVREKEISVPDEIIGEAE